MLYVTFGSPVHLPGHDVGSLDLTDCFAICLVFSSQMEQLESHEAGLDGGRFIYSL